MIHVFLLIWFWTAPPPDGNQLLTHQFDSQKACEEAGAQMNDVSIAMKAVKKITDFGGMCYEVQQSNNGST